MHWNETHDSLFEKFSANWKKCKARLLHLHRTIANIRKDFLQKASTAISKKHALVVLRGFARAEYIPFGIWYDGRTGEKRADQGRP